MSTPYPVRFFFGANTPSGFFGYHNTALYDPRDGWIAFLIKSGAGTGKATFMRDVYDTLTAMGAEGEAIFCSSDPASLDAVVFPTLKLCIMDATAPHIVEPTAYGECEQLVPFGCCLPAELAAESAAWFESADACTAAHGRCCRFLAAAHQLLTDARLLVQGGVDAQKVIASATRTAKREFGAVAPTRGKQTRRFLSAVTPTGHTVFTDTVCALCPRIFVLEDDYGAVADLYMRTLCDAAQQAGLDVIRCACPLDPQGKCEHLLIPSIGTGFLTANRFHRMDMPVYRRIHASRFIDPTVLQRHREQLRFDIKAAAELLHSAEDAAAVAKAHHDAMEKQHVAAMDWDLWRTIADKAKADIVAVAEARMS